MILQSIIDIIESVAPTKWAENWDNSGLQVGDSRADIKAALLTTDVTETVVNEAIELGCNLIISHHPLLFNPLHSVTGKSNSERCLAACIKHDIAVYSAHTTIDKYVHGVSGRMAQKMGIKDYCLLAPDDKEYGLGVVGDLPAAMSPEAFMSRLKEVFGAKWLRYTASPKPYVKRIAFCGGSGADLTYAAVQCNADAYVTADCRYHQFQQYSDQIMMVDMDHWVSEHFTRDIFSELLEGKVKTYISQADYSPINIY